MAVSTQQLAEELQIFGLDYEDSLLEKLVSVCEQEPLALMTAVFPALWIMDGRELFGPRLSFTGPIALPAVAELCVLYRQTEDGMVSELIAFCTSAGKTCLTVDILNSFEYEVLNKKLSKAWHSASKDSGHAGTRDIVSIQELIEAEEEEETLLSSYTTPSKTLSECGCCFLPCSLPRAWAMITAELVH